MVNGDVWKILLFSVITCEGIYTFVWKLVAKNVLPECNPREDWVFLSTEMAC